MGDAEKSAVEKTEQELNIEQRANFYIIRKLWILIRGQRRGGQTVFQALNMSRPRYERFLHGSRTRLTHDELAIWKAMGIPQSVIQGKKLIPIPFLGLKDWEDFFEKWDLHRETKGSKDEYKKAKRKIDDRIKEADVEDSTKIELYQVSTFIKNTVPQASATGVKILAITNNLSSVTPGELHDLAIPILERYVKSLQEQLKLSEAILTILTGSWQSKS